MGMVGEGRGLEGEREGEGGTVNFMSVYIFWNWEFIFIS